MALPLNRPGRAAGSLDLRQLAAFHRVATLRSFTKAAAELNYAQSSVTSQIKNLEASLGVDLFERSRGQVRLTPAGEQLAPYAERILALVDEARERTAGWAEPAGLLSVGAIESLVSYRMPPVLEYFHHQFPLLRLSLRAAPGGQIREALRQGTLDLGVFMDARTEHSGLRTEVLRDEPLVAIAAPGHPLAGACGLATEDLVSSPILVPEPGACYRGLLEAELAGSAGRSASTLLEFGTVEAIKRGVAAGLGVSVVPEFAVADGLAAGSLVALDWPVPFTVRTQIAWRRSRQVSRSMRAFVEQTTAASALCPTSAPAAAPASQRRKRTDRILRCL
ncbi:LysR family transcriptional regulator [Streptomyces sp. NPDC048604]|uniref:LysR family transcriptional regulator n=1 Tax=Streptomyces sp. NPDC048604 TaxID=3365578 RepID=UPI003713DA40